MKHKGLIALGLILITAFAVGVLWATDTSAPVEQTPEPAPLPSDKLPGDDAPPAEEVGLCLQATSCPTVPCGQPGCTIAVPENCSTVDLGVRCCIDNGELLECAPGKTVHRTTCDCDADCPHLPLSKHNSCE